MVLRLGENKVSLKNYAYTAKEYLDAFRRAGLEIEFIKKLPADDLTIDPSYANKDFINFSYGIFKLRKAGDKKLIY